MLWVPQKHYPSPRHSGLRALPAPFETSLEKKMLFVFLWFYFWLRNRIQAGNGSPTITTPVISEKPSVYFVQVSYNLPSEVSHFLTRNWEEIGKNSFAVRQAWWEILTLWSRESHSVPLNLSYLFNNIEIIMPASQDCYFTQWRKYNLPVL